MRTLILGALVVALALMGVVLAGLALTNDAAADEQGVVRVEEDDPRWDCQNMGNRSCGPAETIGA